MRTIVRSLALALALQAMLLRALLPDGWMPAAGTDHPVILCPGQSDMQGMLMQGMPMHGMPTHHGLPQHRACVCPFATLAQLAAAATAPVITLPVVQEAARTTPPAAFLFVARTHTPQSARAPPLFV